MRLPLQTLALALVTGCGGTEAVPQGPLVNGGMWTALAGSTCNAHERNVTVQASPHVDPSGGAIAYATNPPASGPHYPFWARWGSWPNVPRGNWVHNLEHGGVALLARCPTGTCDDVRAELTRAVASFTADPTCAPSPALPVAVRVVITNDPAVTTAVAGAAWGWLYSADCVEPATLRAFYARHARGAPEDFCADGSFP